MLATTINSYLYQQYADDDDLQAFVAAYNGMTQTYLTWFVSVGLPIYTGLSGELLDWVAQGLYGLARTALSAPGQAATGALNTQALNTAALNTGAPATTIYYALSDDLFQRILTWDFYKGDGKRFCVPWFKRRIMRFLVGANGIDPQPCSPSFVVGAETTSAVGVTINTGSNVVTVNIDQTALGNQFPIAAGVLPVFQQAMQQQLLDLPIQYTYVVNIYSAVTALVAPMFISSSSMNASQTTQAATVSAYSGSGSYTFSWSWASGGVGITINSPTAAVTTFSATGLAQGQNRNGIASCLVIDSVTLEQATITLPVSITNSGLQLVQLNLSPITDNSGNPLLLG